MRGVKGWGLRPLRSLTNPLSAEGAALARRDLARGNEGGVVAQAEGAQGAK